jgi:hypothetical protein
MARIGSDVNYVGGCGSDSESLSLRGGASGRCSMIKPTTRLLRYIQYYTNLLRPCLQGWRSPERSSFGTFSESPRPRVPIRDEHTPSGYIYIYGQSGRLVFIGGDWQVVRSSPRPKLGSDVTASHHPTRAVRLCRVCVGYVGYGWWQFFSLVERPQITRSVFSDNQKWTNRYKSNDPTVQTN